MQIEIPVQVVPIIFLKEMRYRHLAFSELDTDHDDFNEGRPSILTERSGKIPPF